MIGRPHVEREDRQVWQQHRLNALDQHVATASKTASAVIQFAECDAGCCLVLHRCQGKFAEEGRRRSTSKQIAENVRIKEEFHGSRSIVRPVSSARDWKT